MLSPHYSFNLQDWCRNSTNLFPEKLNLVRSKRTHKHTIHFIFLCVLLQCITTKCKILICYSMHIYLMLCQRVQWIMIHTLSVLKKTAHCMVRVGCEQCKFGVTKVRVFFCVFEPPSPSSTQISSFTLVFYVFLSSPIQIKTTAITQCHPSFLT